MWEGGAAVGGARPASSEGADQEEQQARLEAREAFARHKYCGLAFCAAPPEGAEQTPALWAAICRKALWEAVRSSSVVEVLRLVGAYGVDVALEDVERAALQA